MQQLVKILTTVICGIKFDSNSRQNRVKFDYIDQMAERIAKLVWETVKNYSA